MPPTPPPFLPLTLDVALTLLDERLNVGGVAWLDDARTAILLLTAGDRLPA